MTSEDQPTGGARAEASYRQTLHRGFSWLGGATVIAKALDFAVIIVVLLFLTRTELGVASIVVAIGAVVETVNGLGTGTALIQARSLSPITLGTLFWLMIGLAILIGGVMLAAAPWIAAFYKMPGMAIYFLAVAIKQPFVGASLIPTALMNRDLQYKHLAIVSVVATFATAFTRLGLAIGGAGVWAIVAAYAASGVFVLVGVWVAKPFRPAFAFHLASVRPLLRFGSHVLASELLEQTFNNLHYLIVGRLYGAADLAIYRVAFTVAMEPAVAVATLVNQTTLPVFARVARERERLTQVLAWSFGRSAAVVAPLMAAIVLGAGPLTLLIHARGGASYAAAAVPLMLLAGAAFLRVIAQLLYPLAYGSGHPGMAVSLSAMMLLLATAGVLGAGLAFQNNNGIVAIAAAWVAIYPLLLAWEVRHLRRRLGIRVRGFARALVAPLVAIAALLAGVGAVRLAIGTPGPRIELAIIVAVTLLIEGGLFARMEKSARF